MASELADSMFDIAIAHRPDTFPGPDVAGMSSVALLNLDGTKPHVRFLFDDANPHTVLSVSEGTAVPLSDLGEGAFTGVLLRTWVDAAVQIKFILRNDAPEFLLYRLGTVHPLPADPVPLLTPLGTATSQFEMGFLTRDAATLRYLDPAIVVRVLARFDDMWSRVLQIALTANPLATESFGLDRFLAYYDSLSGPSDLIRLLQMIIRGELDLRRNAGIPTTANAAEKYESRLPVPDASGVTRADFVTNYAGTVDASLVRFVFFKLTDVDLGCAVCRADEYEMDLIDVYQHATSFSGLAGVAALSNYAAIVNGPTFDSGACGLQNRATRAWEYAKGVAADVGAIEYRGLTKGLLVFRGQPSRDSDCPTPKGPGDEGKWRYHFGQGLTGQYGLFENFIPDIHNFACALDNVTGVFRNGQRIGVGHQIDTARNEPDSVFASKGGNAGIPLMGRTSRLGHEYVFILIRPDYTEPAPTAQNWEELVSLMREMSVIDAFALDGDDSVGLFINGELVYAPGVKKNSLIPLAVGLRKV
jgi:hypothetical protein